MMSFRDARADELIGEEVNMGCSDKFFNSLDGRTTAQVEVVDRKITHKVVPATEKPIPVVVAEQP